MNPATKTLAAINKQIEDTQESSHRSHLGASVIGKKCTRELFYLFRWTLNRKHNGQLLRLFNRGHLEEARFVGYLRAIGVEVWDTNPNAPLKDGKPQQWRISDHDGHFGGSLDGVGRGAPDFPDKLPFLLEFKTHGANSFKKLVEMGVMGAKWEHFVQMQVYMLKMKLTAALYMAVNKDNDEWHLETIRFDEDVATKAMARAGNVIYANEPPERIATSPGAFACKYCDFNRLCHFGDVTPDRNCRTCRFSRPGGGGRWFCGLRAVDLDEAEQRAGCGSYQVHTKLSGVQP
jgi:hypothetical protein